MRKRTRADTGQAANAEEQIRYTLPAEYLALLKKQNGGYIRFSLPNMTHHVIAGIGRNFPSLSLDDLQEYVSFPLQGLVQFDGDGHWYLCLDYRENSEIPSVTYANIEGDRESRVADSFAGYLSMLQIDIGDDEYVLEAVSDIEAVKAELSASLGISGARLDRSWAHVFWCGKDVAVGRKVRETCSISRHEVLQSIYLG